jgi:hypothetical protein
MKEIVNEWIRNAEGDISLLIKEAAVLTVYAVNVRYPGDSADELDAAEALRLSNSIISIIKEKL